MLKAGLFLAAAAIASSAPAQTAADDGNIHVDETANGRAIRLRRDERLVVTVQACGGCSYSWTLTRLPTNLALLGIDRSANDPPGNPARSESIVIGGSSTVEFWFGAQGAGRGALTLAYGSFTEAASATGVSCGSM